MARIFECGDGLAMDEVELALDEGNFKLVPTTLEYRM